MCWHCIFFFAFRLYQTSFSVFFLSFVAEVCLLFSFICIQFLLLSTFELIMDTTNTHKNTHAHPLAATRLTLYWQEISVYFHLNKFTTNAMFLQNTMDTTVWLWRWKLKNSCCFFFKKGEVICKWFLQMGFCLVYLNFIKQMNSCEVLQMQVLNMPTELFLALNIESKGKFPTLNNS